MAEFALPKNSQIKPGRTWPAPSGAKKTKRFRIYRYEPESGQNPRMDTFELDLADMRADGPGRAGQDQDRGRQHAHLPPLLPRGHLRQLLDEHRRRQHARLHARDRGLARRRHDLPAAAHERGQGPDRRPRADLGPVRVDRALDPDLHAGPREGAAAEPRGAPPARRPLRVHPLLLLHDRPARPTGGTATASSAPPSCSRPTASSPTAGTRRRSTGSRASRTPTGSTAATRS